MKQNYLASLIYSDLSESRSRRLKDCVNRGLGQRLNKQKNHSFCGSRMNGFTHLYILANEPVTLKEMCEMLQKECNAKKISVFLPLGLADKIAQGLEKRAEKTGKKPLMTTFSVYNLARNNEFDYSKAQRELGYTTRPYQETIHDEVQWFIEEGMIQGNPTPSKQSNEELRGRVAVPQMIQAVGQDISAAPAIAPVAAYKAVEEGVANAYKAVEKGAVEAYHKVEDAFVDKLFRRDGETVEEAKDRLQGK